MAVHVCMCVCVEMRVGGYGREMTRKKGFWGRERIQICRGGTELNDKEGYKMFGPIDVLEEQVVLASVRERREI